MQKYVIRVYVVSVKQRMAASCSNRIGLNLIAAFSTMLIHCMGLISALVTQPYHKTSAWRESGKPIP
jgi:hypothetical protein